KHVREGANYLTGSGLELREPMLTKNGFDARYKEIQELYANHEAGEIDFGTDEQLMRDIEAYGAKAVHYYWVGTRREEKERLLMNDIDPATILSELFLMWYRREAEMNGYDPTRGTFKQQVFFTTYLGSVNAGLIAAVVTQLKRNAYKAIKAEKAAADDFFDEPGIVEEMFERNEFYRDIVDCLGQIPEWTDVERKYFVYRITGYSVNDCSDEL
ncbi:MAG TPA: hypothetical protein PLQ76_03675, partial [bacterium]|nr:hypothetical protein [bacterium]